MSAPPKAKTLANDKTWAQLEADAKSAIKHGLDEHWPKIVLQLLKRNYDLELEMQVLRQGELFTPPLVPAEGRGET